MVAQPTGPTPAAPPAHVTVPDLADLQIVDPSYTWNRGQREIVQQIVNSTKKIVMLEAECGSGKSIIGVAAAKAAGSSSTHVLIQTINLQEQYMRDFGTYGARMIEGRSHSTCNRTGKRADWAPCTVGIKCHMKGTWDRVTGMPITTPECNYYARKAEAKLAPFTIANYAYWLAETSSPFASSFGSADWIICDEAHDLDLLLMAAGTIKLTNADMRALSLTPPDAKRDDLVVWKAWAASHVGRVESLVSAAEDMIASDFDIQSPDEPDDSNEIAPDSDDPLTAAPVAIRFETRMQELATARRVAGALKELCGIEPAQHDEWVVVRTESPVTGWEFKPIYGKYGFKRILAAAQSRVLLMSAFLAPDMLIKTLGLDPNDVEIIRAPKAFDRTQDKIYYCPLVKFNYKTPANEWRFAVNAMDRFINFYAPKKGLIHTPSVRLRDTILAESRLSRLMVAYDGVSVNPQYRKYPNKDVAVARFIRTPGSVLVGQSISTGLDIPYEPEFQIIPKLWYMPLEDPAVKKRNAVDPDFYNYYTICQLIQAAGRVKRAQDHHGQTIILDASFGWVYARLKNHFPPWFRDSLVYNGWGNQDFAGIKSALGRSDAPMNSVWKWG